MGDSVIMSMQGRSMAVAIIGSLVMLGIVLEGIRRRRLAEEYSLIWLLTSVALLALSLWPDLLRFVSSMLGIYYPPSALFVIGFGFVLLILLQFSIVISKLARENRSLAQRLGIMQQQIEELLAEQRARSSKVDEPEGDQ